MTVDIPEPPNLSQTDFKTPGLEDESVRDLRRALLTTSSPKRPRTLSDSAVGLDGRDESLLHPEIGRLRDVAQPGGFRRHHVRQQCHITAGTRYANSVLVQLLTPAIALPSLRDRTEFIEDVVSIDEEEHDGAVTQSSNLATAIIIAKVFFGGFNVMVPGGFRESGLVGGPVSLVVTVSLCIHSMAMLIECRELLGPGNTYADLGRVFGGTWGVYMITCLIVLAQTGFICIWLLVGTVNLLLIFPDCDFAGMLWMSIPVLIPLVCVRHLRLFTVTNLIGIAIQSVIASYLVVLALHVLLAEGPRSVDLLNTTNANSLMFLGACAYGFEGVNTVLPVYEAAKHKESVAKILRVVSGSIMVFYAFFGFVFYSAFGADTAPVATENIPVDSIFRLLLPGAMVFVAMCTNPLNFFVLIGVYEKHIPGLKHSSWRKVYENICRVLLIVVLAALTWLGGNQLQNILGLVGGICCSMLALILPACIHIIVAKPKPLPFILDVFSGLLGCIIMVSSTTQAIMTWGQNVA
eukprot:TRINITY_DN8636_c0_g1_i7.p1 TRINITY_DN8636_c0_g1~~TRINITY_DN8636_c0_g1_i7.p1  ORF type:complete len:521 (+),score=52.88 TRINITY_DN8636_c0_g1_i7:51-1613(+)